MNDREIELEKQFEKDIEQARLWIRMMIKVALYTSFVLIFGLSISTIIRGFMYGFT